MRLIFLLFSSLSLLSFWSCQKEVETYPPLIVSIDSIAAQSGMCGKDSLRCTKASALFPIVYGGKEGVSERINDTLGHYASRMIGFGDEDIETPYSAVRAFVANYDEFMLSGNAGGYSIPWECEFVGQVLYQNDSLLSIRLDNYSFSGGAHPNTEVRLFNFRSFDGSSLTYADLFQDEEAFKQLAIQYFQKSRDLSSQKDMFDAGFFWEGKFVLPENFAIQEEGILLFYNTYEVAPYALGATPFVIPWEELDGIVQETFEKPAS